MSETLTELYAKARRHLDRRDARIKALTKKVGPCTLKPEAAGFAIRTEGGAGRFERKVDIPDSWVSGFLQLQGAMALPGTRVRVRPVDLLAAIRFLHLHQAKVSPRARGGSSSRARSAWPLSRSRRQAASRWLRMKQVVRQAPARAA